MHTNTRYPLALLLIPCLLFANSFATTYRVGPGEKNGKVSDVASTLKPGDVVEVVGDIVDSVTLTRSGTEERPVVLRGVMRAADGKIIRPRVTGAGIQRAGGVVVCKADWNVIEGLDIQVDRDKLIEGASGIRLAGDNLVVRNCRLHHSQRGLVTDEGLAGNVLVEFCEFDSNYLSVQLYYTTASNRPLATATVQHCYIHDSTGGYTMLRAEYPRVVVRYNWFENATDKAVTCVGPARPTGRRDPQMAGPWPAHADIVGNVFFHGVSPDGTHTILTIGGEDEENTGPEGDFSIAYNLFVRPENGWGQEVSSYVMMLPNVDNVRLYNNVFLDYVNAGSSVYNVAWLEGMYPNLKQSPGGAEFAARRGGKGDAIVSGANNWVSQGAKDVPESFENTTRGLNPKFVDFLGGDDRPRPDSPLAYAGLASLPQGRVISLVPECEPQRGIPADLVSAKRRQVARPSIGPFEVPEGDLAGAVHGAPDPDVADDAVEMVLSLKSSGARFPWELEFGEAREKALTFLRQGEKEKALQAARMQFILCPPDDRATRASIDSVKQMLEALDGNDVRARAFEIYAIHGPDGLDGRANTGDDLKNPIADVPLTLFARRDAYYQDLDREIDMRMAFSTEGAAKKGFYETEKAFARLNGGAFNDAAAILLENLGELVTLDAKTLKAYDGHADFPRVQYQMDSIRLGLGVCYRATTGTTKGLNEFIANCIKYCTYGPMGEDRKLGTQDDLTPPL